MGYTAAIQVDWLL